MQEKMAVIAKSIIKKLVIKDTSLFLMQEIY